MDWLFQRNETGGRDYSYAAIGSLKLVSIFCAKRISANESKKARVDSAPWFRLTRSTCNPSRQPPVLGEHSSCAPTANVPPQRELGNDSGSVDSVLRAVVFKACGSTDPMRVGRSARRIFAQMQGSSR